MNTLEAIEKIHSKTKEESNLELLAEEAVELAHAALKKARILRGENPTPMTLADVDSNLEEEYSDVLLVSRIVFDLENQKMMQRISENQAKKLLRWIDRIEHETK